MKIEEIMVKDVKYVSSDDYVSKALGIMKNNKIHQLLVMDNDKLCGILELRKIVTRDIDPKITKVHTILSNSPILKKDDTIEKCTETLLSSGLRALPVVEKNKIIGIVSETDLLRVAEKFIDTNMDAKEISSVCVYAEKTDNIGKIKKIMMDKNISRVPVVDKGRVIGVVQTMDLIKLMEGRESMEATGGKLREKGFKQKISINSMTTESMLSAPTLVRSGLKIKDIIELLRKNEEVIIDDSCAYIITPKDVLELIVSKPKKGVYVQITGMQNESSEFQAKTDQTVDDFVKRMGKMIKNIDYLFIHVDKMGKGGKNKYSVRIRFMTPFGLFVSHAWGWHPIDVMQSSFNKLQKEILKKYERIEDRGHGK